jgi:hypothetical protein
MEYTSALEMSQSVRFTPMEKHCVEHHIAKNEGFGIIVGIRFTKAKVFYDIVDDYWGILFRDVDSINVKPLESNEKLEE